MADLTLFELHFHDGFDFAPSAVTGGGDAADVDDDGSEETDGADAESGGRGPGVGALVGLVLLVVLGVAVRKLLGDDLDPIEELEELDESDGE
ncbi:hypothetical protein [Halobaculum sp. EA56]|uniref:hypothetical protein n=1 Tax=Halobaculum sp. EA56 TaxID=3421648 RepID=UPI003EBC310E